MHHQDIDANEGLWATYQSLKESRQRAMRAFAFGDEAAWTGPSPACPAPTPKPPRYAGRLFAALLLVAIVGALCYPRAPL